MVRTIARAYPGGVHVADRDSAGTTIVVRLPLTERSPISQVRARQSLFAQGMSGADRVGQPDA